MARRWTPGWYGIPSDAGSEGRWRRVLRLPLFGGAMAVLGFLVLLWPLVRSPPVSVADANVLLFGGWAAFIVLLAGMARAAGPDEASRPEDDDA